MFCRTTRVRATGVALALAALLAVPFAATASAGPRAAADHPVVDDVAVTGGATVPRTTTPPDEGDELGSICLLCWLASDAGPSREDVGGDDDLWQSECDDAGNCQSVPYGSFKDPGPGAPGGPFGSGPRW
jgi:hypothetical protein